MKYHTILFDLDGTLLNTLEDLTDAVNYVMDAYDFPEHSIEDVRCFVGNGIRVLMQRAILEGEENPQFDEAFELFKRYYLAHNKVKTRPYDGIMELLGELKRRGVPMAIVSNKNQPTVEALCEEEFQGLISVAVGDGEGRARKPAPDGPMEAIRRLGISGTDGVLYVGDSEVDAQTAENAGLGCVLVTWGFRTRQEMAPYAAFPFIDRPEELLEFV